METRPGADDHDDRISPDGTLDDIHQAQQRLARRVAAPWWYHHGAALCIAVAFLGFSLFIRIDLIGAESGEATATALIVLGAIVGPPALVAALKRHTGIAMDRYSRGTGVWYAVLLAMLLVMLALAMLTEIFTVLPQLLYFGTVAAFVTTLLLERHIDRRLRQRLSSGPQPPQRPERPER